MNDYKELNQGQCSSVQNIENISDSEYEKFDVNEIIDLLNELLSKKPISESDHAQCTNIILFLQDNHVLISSWQACYLFECILKLSINPFIQNIDAYLCNMSFVVSLIDQEQLNDLLLHTFPDFIKQMCTKTNIEFELLLNIESIIYSKTNIDIMLIPFQYIVDNFSVINPISFLNYASYAESFKLTNEQLSCFIELCISCVDEKIYKSFEVLSKHLLTNQQIYKDIHKIENWIIKFQNIFIKEEINETIPIIYTLIQNSNRFDLIQLEYFFPSNDQKTALIGCQTIKWMALNNRLDPCKAIDLLCTDAVDYRIHTFAVEYALDIILERNLFSHNSFNFSLNSLEFETSFITPKALSIMQQSFVNEESESIKENMLSLVEDNFDDLLSHIEQSCPKLAHEFISFLDHIRSS